MSEKHVYSFELAGRPLTFEMGELAKQANASVLVRYGDTVVLTAAVASKEPKDIDFFPLTIGYEERLYAVGKVPGGFIKREGRPSEHAILAGRLIDRPIRPLFPDGFRNDVQVINYVMSVDHDNSPEIAAMIGSSLALSISDIPFEGPIAGVVVGRINGEFVLNPTVEQLEQSDIDLTVAGTKDAVNMVEAGAKEVPVYCGIGLCCCVSVPGRDKPVARAPHREDLTVHMKACKRLFQACQVYLQRILVDELGGAP